MTNIKARVGGVLAAGAMAASVFAPGAFADTSVTVQNNGAWSHNGVHVTQSQSSSVSQSNTTNVTNHVSTSQNTGHNSASFNVGGTSTVHSGNANSSVLIGNVGGGNVNTDDGCGCPEGDVDVVVKRNGAFSFNHVDVTKRFKKSVRQTNDTDFRNRVYTHQNTGWNKANFNVGSGSDVTSGKTDVVVDVFNQGGGNEN